jgi:hypothetical protein
MPVYDVGAVVKNILDQVEVGDHPIPQMSPLGYALQQFILGILSNSGPATMKTFEAALEHELRQFR